MESSLRAYAVAFIEERRHATARRQLSMDLGQLGDDPCDVVRDPQPHKDDFALSFCRQSGLCDRVGETWCPGHFHRIKSDDGSFATEIRNQPFDPHRTTVRLYA